MSALRADLRHPDMFAEYIRIYDEESKRLADLETAPAKGIRTGQPEAARAMRELVATVTVSRDANRKGRVEVEVAERLNRLPGPKAFPQGVKGVWGRVIAKARFGRRIHRPDVRFCIRSCA